MGDPITTKPPNPIKSFHAQDINILHFLEGRRVKEEEERESEEGSPPSTEQNVGFSLTTLRT